MRIVIFYSWQSELPKPINCDFIKDALENAVKAIQNETSFQGALVIDHDTKGVAGSPDIVSTIREKIWHSDIFVCDMSTTNAQRGRLARPNSNVLTEWGMALARLGTERIIMVLNEEYGWPEDMPFNLRQHRAIGYRMTEDTVDKVPEGRRLEKKLIEALSTILKPLDMREAEVSYRKQVRDAYNWLNLKGVGYADPSVDTVPLTDIFVHLGLTRERVVSQADDPTTLIDPTKTSQRTIPIQESVELVQAMNKNLLLVGEPGAGKSTFLRWLAIVFAEKLQRDPQYLGPGADQDRLPILIELGHLPPPYLDVESGESPDWAEFLPTYVTTSQKIFDKIPPELLKQALADGRCLLLFDGLDEVANEQVRDRLARSLVELARSLLWQKNRIIIGSRPAGVQESESILCPLFQKCQIKRFSPENIKHFFTHWYSLDTTLSHQDQRKAVTDLSQYMDLHPKLLQLAATPLLSTILLLIWRNKGTLPDKRVDLYERCCHILLGEWERHHDIVTLPEKYRLEGEQYLRLLIPLANFLHTQEQRSSAKFDELQPVLARTLYEQGIFLNEAEARKEAYAFLKVLTTRSGLLQLQHQDNNNDYYGFTHHAFQEYLTARYIAEQPEDSCITLIMKHRHEAWWQQVCLLVIAHLSSRSETVARAVTLIKSILHQYQKPKLSLPFLDRYLRPQVEYATKFWIEVRCIWIVARELELAIRGYAECTYSETMANIGKNLSVLAKRHIKRIFLDPACLRSQNTLLLAISELPSGSEIVVNALLEALSSKNEDKRYGAAESLGEIGIGSEQIINLLIDLLHSEDYWKIKRAAAQSLIQLGANNEQAISKLLQVLSGREGDTVYAILQALATNTNPNEKIVNSLIDIFFYRRNVLFVKIIASRLGEIGAGNQTVIRRLLSALSDQNLDLNTLAVLGLGEVGIGDEQVIHALLDKLDGADPLPNMIVESLGKIGKGSDEIIQVLSEAFYHKPSISRAAIVAGLSKVGANNEQVMNALLEARYDQDWMTRMHTAEGLGEIEGKRSETIGVLLQMLNDPEQRVRVKVVESLGKIGEGDSNVIQSLLYLLRPNRTEMYVLMETIKSLKKVGTSNEQIVRALLLCSLRDISVSVRAMASESLGEMEIHDNTLRLKTFKALALRLYDGSYEVRQSAHLAIRQLWDGQPAPTLQRFRWQG